MQNSRMPAKMVVRPADRGVQVGLRQALAAEVQAVGALRFPVRADRGA